MRREMTREEVLRALQESIGHTFESPALLEQALVHPSFSHEHHAADYQRLEFLGDAVVELVVSEFLFRAFPQSREGQLSAVRKHLLEKSAHAAAALSWGVGPAIRLGRGEIRGDGWRKPGILADVFEAVVGAVFLDAGFEASRRVLEPWMDQAVRHIKRVKDPKTELQEAAQSRFKATPEYQTLETVGPSHEPVFRVAVTIGGIQRGEGRGASKRQAQQAAAEMALAGMARSEE